jgi:hypothetical protein
MTKVSFGMALASLALVASLASPSAFASGSSGSSGGGGGTSGGGGGNNITETGGSSSSTSGVCMKLSAQAVAAFSYYTSLTLSDTIQNCSSQSQTVQTIYAPGPGASAGCVSQLSVNNQSAFVTILPGGRAQQGQGFFAMSPAAACAVGEPIEVSVVAHSGQVLATTQASWTTGVAP